MGDSAARIVTAAEGASIGRIGLAMLVTAAVLWLTLQFAAYGVVSAAFGGLATGALVIIGAGVAAGVALVFVLRPVLGRRSVGASITVTLVAGAAAGIAIAVAGRLPVMWVAPGLDVVYPAVAMSTAPLVGVFTRHRVLQVLGSLTLLAGVVTAVSVLKPEPPLNDLTQPRPPEIQLLEYAELRRDALVIDLPGYEVQMVEPNYSEGTTTVLTAPDGGVIVVEVNRGDWIAEDLHQCWAIAEPDMGLTDEDTVEGYAAWCFPDGDGWVRADGLSKGWWQGRDFLVVRAMEPDSVGVLDASGPASAEQVAEGAGHLRVITGDELRDAFEKSIPEGER